jgi:hypothetical protein
LDALPLRLLATKVAPSTSLMSFLLSVVVVVCMILPSICLDPVEFDRSPSSPPCRSISVCEAVQQVGFAVLELGDRGAREFQKPFRSRQPLLLPPLGPS